MAPPRISEEAVGRVVVLKYPFLSDVLVFCVILFILDEIFLKLTFYISRDILELKNCYSLYFQKKQKEEKNSPQNRGEIFFSLLFFGVCNGIGKDCVQPLFFLVSLFLPWLFV